MTYHRLFLNRLITGTLIVSLVFLSAIATANPVVLDGATFGYQRTIPLRSTIGPRAIPTFRVIRMVGGVAFVREAVGVDGWEVQGMHYDRKAVDGARLSVTLTQNDGEEVKVHPRVWDWELIPLARFVESEFDSAFTFFGELPEGTHTTIPNARVVSYHPALEDTLMGLRMMQLDLFLFQEPFAGYFTDSKGVVILGNGERPSFGQKINPSDKTSVSAEREKIRNRIQAGMALLKENCEKNQSITCVESLQPFSSYIVGDMITPTSFFVSDRKLQFKDHGICWDFSRDADPGESSTEGLEGVVLLRTLSKDFCTKVRGELSGMHPILYRAGNRAMRYSALMRHYKMRNPVDFSDFVGSMKNISPSPAVSTPTEIAVESPITDEELMRFFEQLRRLEQPSESNP